MDYTPNPHGSQEFNNTLVPIPSGNRNKVLKKNTGDYDDGFD